MLLVAAGPPAPQRIGIKKEGREVELGRFAFAAFCGEFIPSKDGVYTCGSLGVFRMVVNVMLTIKFHQPGQCARPQPLVFFPSIGEKKKRENSDHNIKISTLTYFSSSQNPGGGPSDNY